MLKYTNKKQNDTKFLFYGIILYYCIYYTQIGSRLPALSIVRIEFVVGTIMLLIIITNILQKKISLAENRLTYAAIIFFAICGITIPLALVKSSALNRYIQSLKFFSIYLMILSSIDNEKKLKTFLYIHLALISLLFVEPFILSLQGKGFIYNNHMMRLAGVTQYFGHPNQLGGIVSSNLPLFWFLIPYHKSVKAKLLLILLLIIAIWVVMLTQSRTAFIGVFTFIGFVWLVSSKKVMMILLFLVSIIIMWQFAPEQTKNRFMTLGRSMEIISRSQKTTGIDNDGLRPDADVASMNSRWILLKRSLIVFKENPILGVGVGCYSSASGRKWNSWLPTHNLYTQALSEIGLIGTIAFLYVIIIMLKNINHAKYILKLNNDRSFIYYLNSALFVFLAVRLVVGLFGHDLYDSWWWFAGGLSVVILRILEEKYPYRKNMEKGLL